MTNLAREPQQLHPHLLRASEMARWHLEDIAWDQIAVECASPALIEIVRRAALAEMTTYEATQRFMDSFFDDVDFSRWLAVWFYEETRHPVALARWLARFGVTIPDAEVLAARKTEPFVRSKVGTLAINVIAEVTAAAGYVALAKYSSEPILSDVARRLAGDESRHAAAFYLYTKKSLELSPTPERDRRYARQVLRLWLDRRQSLLHPGMALQNDSATLSPEPQQAPDDGTTARICHLFELLTAD